MSDLSADLGDIDAGPEPTPLPTPEPEPDLPPAADDAADPDGFEEWPQSAKDELHKLREQNKTYRERWQPLERVFAPLPESDQEQIAQLAYMAGRGDVVGMADWLGSQTAAIAANPQAVQILQRHGLSKAEAQQVVAAAKEAEADKVDEPEYLTRADAEKLAGDIVARSLAQQGQYQAAKAEADGAFGELGIDPLSDWGVAVRTATSAVLDQNPGMGIGDAIREAAAALDRQANERVSARAKRQREASQAGGAPVPAGGAAPNGTKLDPRSKEAAQARRAAAVAALSNPTDQ